MPSAMYTPATIFDADNLPIMWRNNHEFHDDSGLAPKDQEVFLLVFTEPWMAYAYLKSEGLSDANISLINTQEALDFLRLVGDGEKIARMAINPCNLQNEMHERIFSLLPLEETGTIESFVSTITDAEVCPVCYSKESFVASNNMEEFVTVIRSSEE